MNIFLKNLIEDSIFDEEKKLYIKQAKAQNLRVLAFKFDNEYTFLIENPSTEEISEIISLLTTKSLNFLLIEQNNSERFFCTREDKAQYNSFIILKDKNILSSTVSSSSSVLKIINRFLENSLFDNRPNELRYLKKDFWYNYATGEWSLESHYPIDVPLSEIGLFLGETTAIRVYDSLFDIPIVPINEDLESYILKKLSYIEMPILEIRNYIDGLSFLTFHDKDNFEKLKNLSLPIYFEEQRKFLYYTNDKYMEEWFVMLQFIEDGFLDLDVHLKSPSKELFQQVVKRFFEEKSAEITLVISRPHSSFSNRNSFYLTWKLIKNKLVLDGVPNKFDSPEALIEFLEDEIKI